MRRTTSVILSVGVIVALGLAGCGAPGQATGGGPSVARGTGVILSQDYTDALPAMTQLAVGSFKLNETDLAITPEQAQELVPLWQAYRTLWTSQTAAQQEREALEIQIEQTMTVEQLEAIAAMKLTAADMQSVFRNRIPLAEGTPGGTPEPGRRQSSGQGGRFFGGGGFPGDGNFPGGSATDRVGFFGGLAPGQTPNPQSIETLRADRGGAAGEDFGINPGLIGALIQFLQQNSSLTPVPTPTSG